jgi:dehydrogenase/reductase SDR family protein 12
VTAMDQGHRAVAWGVDALLEASVAGSFSSIGYAARSRLLPEFTRSRSPDMSGRQVVITGATSGIGLAAATRLAGLGASICFLARNRERAERARAQIAAAAARAGHSAATVDYGLADLDDLASVREFAAGFAATRTGLDVLIHNAGAIYPRYGQVSDGTEHTMASQVVAPFLLTHLLLGALERAAPSRVITVSSGGMYTSRLDAGHPQPVEAGYSGLRAYAMAKRAQVALSAQWAARTAGTGIAFHAMHPGWVRTPGIAASLPVFSRVLGPMLRSPGQGADTIVWLATADAGKLGSGLFWHDRRVRPVYRRLGPRPESPEAAALLWDWVATRAGSGTAAAARPPAEAPAAAAGPPGQESPR